MGSAPQASARPSETRFTLEEWFSDFHLIDDLDFPAHWTIQLTLATRIGTFLAKWELI